MPSIIRTDEYGVAAFHMAVPGTSGDSVCTLGFNTDSADGQAVADKLSQAWATNVMPIIDGDAVFTGATTNHRIGGNLESWISHAGDPSPGSGGNFPLPANCAVLVQKRTGLAGKKNRGRMYLPAVPRANILSATDPNTLLPAKLTLVQAAMDAFYAALIVSGGPDVIQPMILHPLPNPLQGTVILSFSVQARIATQRDRLRD